MKQSTRLAIYARDGGICGLCGNPVALVDLDIDHIVHRVAGGSDAPDNLRATHGECNRKRGARGVPGAYRRPYTRGTDLSVAIRFPDDVYVRVKAMARQDLRSFSAEVAVLLEEGIRLRAAEAP